MRSYADVAQLVAHHLAKVDVASSSLVIRSIIYNKAMDQQSHLFDEIKASTRLQMAKEIIEGIQALNIGTYLEAQTINRAIEVVKGTSGISQ